MKAPGRLRFDAISPLLRAAVEGHGIAFAPGRPAAEALEDGRLQMAPEKWRRFFPGLHFHHPSRWRPCSAFEVMPDALRERS